VSMKTGTTPSHRGANPTLRARGVKLRMGVYLFPIAKNVGHAMSDDGPQGKGAR